MQKSVALCTYNGETYIREQLDSILKQTISVQEIIICDDHSTDQTFTIIEKYRENHPGLFKIFMNKKNLGYVKNFEKAISLCSGDLIFLSDQDDVWYENKVEKVEKSFLENKNINVLCHNVNLLGDEFKTEKNYWHLRNFTTNKSNSEILEMVFLSGNIFPGMAMVITKEAKEKYLPLRKINQLIIHDFELILRACKDNSFYTLDEILGDYRLHEEQNIGFDTRILDKKITANHIYTRHNSIQYITDLTEEFDLDQSLVEQYIANFKAYLSEYLTQFPIWKRPFIKVKMKHYYKIK
ncbi:glycosyltransferase [Kaistella jeonii]|uniref:glycosyltransferase n=1 Tax=Kaistella jeonii TaxID=266749 RepID=UPI00068DF0BB|nr:glycosyltransferase [Kaistella jeonii]SFB80921.1 Glycosyl transferase family 2 [Kaistella jeonii]VEI96178.1 Chondroitin polymerase [Kaistella jeonii]